MQTLGISESTPRSESRLKSLFWPSIKTGVDVDYLAVQGYWVANVVGVLTLVILAATDQLIIGLATFLLFHLGAVGVREHSRFAATIIFSFYLLDFLASFRMLLASPAGSVLRVVITALLLSNLRATWIAAGWRTDSEEAALPPRFGETLRDKFVDKWPAWIWPKLRVLYYIFSAGFLLTVVLGLIMIASGRAH